MSDRSRWVPVSLAMLLSAGCAGTTLPPALPDDRVRFAETAAHPLEAPGYPTPEELLEAARPRPPTSPPPVLYTEVVRQTVQAKPGRRCGRCQGRLPSAEQLVRSANAEATVGPRTGGLRASAVVRYDYNEDHIYEVYAAPNAATFLRSPPGHHLGAPLTLNQSEEDGWIMGKVVMRLPGDIDQEGWQVRPARAGLEGYASVISQEGFVAKCKFTSFAKTGMMEVTWNWTPPLLAPEPAGAQGHQPPQGGESLLRLTAAASRLPEGRPPPRVILKAPSVNVERLHTGYTIEVVGKHTPPWMPTSVLDDGSKTIIKFRESLSFTSAPDLLAIHPDGAAAPVEFTPYQSDNGETMMYIAPGLFPQLSLRGRDGLHVKITRVPHR